MKMKKILVYRAEGEFLPQYDFTGQVVLITESKERGREMIMNGHETYRNQIYGDEGKDIWGDEKKTPCEYIGGSYLSERIVCVSGVAG